jgi:hypothetical protein
MPIILKNTNSIHWKSIIGFTVKRCNNNKVCYLKYMNKKGNCKNCGDDITDDSNSNEFCSEQCGVEYQMEHNRK